VSYGVTCVECGGDLPFFPDRKSSRQFCSPKCGYKARDRARYSANPEGERERARAYYWRNREAVLEKAAARRGRTRPPERTTCTECGGPLEGRARIVCSRRCTDARYRRLHPEKYAELERRKVVRRREARRKARAA